MTTETPADEAETGVPSISDILAGNSSSTHDGHREVGQPTEPDGVPSSSAQPAPTAETPPATAPASTAAPAASPDPAADPKAPRWYREHMAKTNRELAQTRAELDRTRQAPARAPADAALSDEEMNRPLTRAELLQFHERQRLSDKVERSEEAFSDKHGEDTLEEVRAWLMSKATPQGNAMENWAMAQRNPWAAAFQQYQREKIADEIGDDPSAYRAKLEAEIRAEYEARTASTPPPAPAAPTMRAAPPLPASTARSSAPGRDASGRFAGPQPIGALSKHKFG